MITISHVFADGTSADNVYGVKVKPTQESENAYKILGKFVRNKMEENDECNDDIIDCDISTAVTAV